MKFHNLARSDVAGLFQGAISLESHPDGLQPWRINHESRHLCHPELSNVAQYTSGVRLRFCTGARVMRAGVTVFDQMRYFEGGRVTFDIVEDGRLVHTLSASCEAHTMLEIPLQGNPDSVIEIYFPTRAKVRLHCLQIPEDSTLGMVVDTSPRWITYGSSISQCARAHNPAFTWPAIAARSFGWNSFNLGFSGQCKLDPCVARTIAEKPWDRISLCLGVNTCQNAFSPRTWKPAVEGFISLIRDRQPHVPLLIISPTASESREQGSEREGMIGLQQMRIWLEEIVDTYRSEQHDSAIFYLDGRKLMGPADRRLMPDGLHPEAEGIRLMGERFIQLAPALWRGN